MSSDNIPMTPVLLLKSPQAAEALAISPRTLWSMTNSGELPCVRFGGSVRYSADDLRAWIEQQKVVGERVDR